MTQAIQQKLSDKAWARWTALVLIALMMFFGYMFCDVMSPLESLIEMERGWTPQAFGHYAASEFVFNILGFLIIGGIILDKCGIRFTGTLSASLMFIGASIKFIGINSWFQTTALADWLNSWWLEMPASAKMASLGFMLYGCGCEMAGTVATKAIAKWFKGKEIALAMGLEMAIARIGVFAIFSISPLIAEHFGTVVAPVAFCTLLLLIGLICYLVFCVFDWKLDQQSGGSADVEPEEEFKVSDILTIFSSKIFWIVSILCVCFYSAISPFQRYGANMLQCNLGISAETASNIFRWFPIGAAIITPLLGSLLDKRGKGATMLIWGSLLLFACQLVFAFVVPATGNEWIAYAAIILIGISFALVPAALWPSVPKIIDEKMLGSAYCLIFWMQNIGMCVMPVAVGHVLSSTNAHDVMVERTKDFIDNYQNALSAIDTNDAATLTTAFEAADASFASLETAYGTLTGAQKTSAVDDIFAAAKAANTAMQQSRDNLCEYLASHPTAPQTETGFWEFFSPKATSASPAVIQQDRLEHLGTSVYIPYDFTWPLVMFAVLGLLAFFISIYLKMTDRKKGYGLELPNIQS